jgi:IS4 transposase
VARTLALPKGSIVAMDRGYVHYELFVRWTREDGVYFVSRLKSNLPYKVLRERPLPSGKPHLLRDEEIQLSSDRARKHCPYPLRRVVVWDAENQREIELLTNHMDFAADTISAIYRERWKVELFFKALKQNLKVKTFLGTSRNALEVQLWTGLFAMLLVTFLRWLSRRGWSLSNLMALLRLNLFQYKDLRSWLDDPFETPPGLPDHPQATLPGFDFGQLPTVTAAEAWPQTWEPPPTPSPA